MREIEGEGTSTIHEYAYSARDTAGRWGTVKCHGTYRGIAWEVGGIPWEVDGVPWVTLGNRWDTLGYGGTRWDTVGVGEIPCTPWDTLLSL